MRFALFEHVSWPSGASHSQVFREATAQVQRAEELGFHCAWLAEHHFTQYGLASASMLLATHIAAHTSRIRLGTGITIASIRNPVLLAEEAATLDILSDGRLDFGVGSGGAPELRGFGISREESRERFAETVDAVLGLWTTPVYSHHGKFFDIEGVGIGPSPVQKPYPPLYAAVRNPWSVEFAVDRNMRHMTGVTATTDEAMKQRQAYLDVAAQRGKVVDPLEMPLFRYVYVADTDDEVRRDTKEHLLWVWECLEWQQSDDRRTGLSLDEWLKRRKAPSVSYEELYEKHVFFGTPAKVRRQVEELHRQGIEYFGGSFGFGGLGHANAVRSMDLFAREVMPNFQPSASRSA